MSTVQINMIMVLYIKDVSMFFNLKLIPYANENYFSTTVKNPPKLHIFDLFF